MIPIQNKTDNDSGSKQIPTQNKTDNNSGPKYTNPKHIPIPIT